MYVASLELCQELYELSRWQGDGKHWYKGQVIQESWLTNYLHQVKETVFPAYDLGYLMRQFLGKGGIELRYGDIGCIATSSLWSAEAASPENAVCKLLIEMFKQGVIRRMPK